MRANFQFDSSLDFAAEDDGVLREIPALPGVFALYGSRAEDEPYMMRAADLRRRIVRLLAPPESQSRRLNLRERVARIDFSVSGSEFESAVLLYRAVASRFGLREARRRLRLHTPFFLRLVMENAHPRVYSSNRLSRRALAQTYGPFPSRAAAERYCDAVLDLFKLRRCYEDLRPYPEHPGCAYGEMKMCLAPCNQSCSAEEYAAEAEAVKAFFDSRGESMLAALATARDRASAEMDFEAAAAAHAQWAKVKAVAALANEVVRPVSALRAVIVQPAAKGIGVKEAPEEAAVFLLEAGAFAGPQRLSILGVRAVKEQTSVGSSLFAQPLMLQAVPLGGPVGEEKAEGPEQRAGRVLEQLAKDMREGEGVSDVAAMSDHLSLFRRWYYRPEKQRVGEVFLPGADGAWPIRAMLRGAARVVLGDPGAMAETQREAAKGAKMRILHEGRADVERAVPVGEKPLKRPRAARSSAAGGME